MGGVVGALAVVGLLLLPTGLLGTSSAGAAPPSTASAVVRPSAHAVPPATALPGATGTGRFVDAPQLFRIDRSWVVPPTSSHVAAPARLGGAPAAAVPPDGSASRTGTRPGASLGWISGVVDDSVYLTPISGVNVAFQGCAVCVDGTTNASGGFRIESPAGPSQIVFLDSPDYLVNRTFPTVVAGTVTSIGTVLLVHTATVDGRVLGDNAAALPIVNVTVTSVSRDGALGGPNLTLTLPNGTFSLVVDPVPIEVDFAPPPGAYLANATYAAPTPWQVLDLGTIFLEGGVNATVTVLDGVTGTPVEASASFCSQRIEQACFPAGSGNGTVSLPTVPGPGLVTVEAGGYVTNVTQARDVPNDPSGVPSLGTVRLLPAGSLEVTVNFTGGTPNDSWPSALPGTGGGFDVVACSLAGMDPGGSLASGLASPGCLGTSVVLGVTTLVPAPPLRDLVLVLPGWAIPAGFPLAAISYQGGIDFPNGSLANVSWANVTPDHVTDLGTLNVTAGTYLNGSVAPGATNAGVTVQVCSTVRTAECLPRVETTVAGQIGITPVGCPTGPWEFCVPAPPGPDRVDVNWGTVGNSTWLTVPFGCCAQEDHPTNVGEIGMPTIPGGGTGMVHGILGVEGEPASYVPPDGWDAGVTVCPVDAPDPCYQGPANTTGAFSSAAPLGWDVVLASGPGFRSNSTWVDVVHNNSTGEIELGYDASYGGQVVSSTTGLPILEATISVCNVAPSHPCATGTSTSSSNGTYNGTVAALPFPSGTFEFAASASGFDPESTFVNVTPGEPVSVPTLRLPPIGSLGVRRPGEFSPHGANSSSPTTGSWVVGRAVDSVSGLDVGDAEVTVCPIASATGCLLTTAQTNTGGALNLSTVHGAYQIWINGTYYNPRSLYVNASSAGTVDLGAIRITPLDRISGRVLIDPWSSLFGTYGEGADQVVLSACNPAGVCGPSGATGTDGSFNVSAPAGTPDTLYMIGGGPQGQYGTTLGGYNSSGFVVPVASPYVRLNGTGVGGSVSLPILGGLTGFVTQSIGNATPPAWFSDFAVNPPGVVGGATGYFVGGGGFYAAFFAAGLGSLRTTAGALGLVPTTSAASYGTVRAGVVTAGPNVTTTPFGFLEAEVRDATTGAAVDGDSVAVLGGGPGNQTLSGDAESNGAGYVNVTAPPGYDAVTTSPIAYAAFSSTTTIHSDAIDAFGPINLTELPGGGYATLRSLEVNSVGVPPTPGAFDNATDHPVEGLSVVESAPGGVQSLPAFGNDLGQYFLAALPSPNGAVAFDALGYSAVTQTFNFTPGRTVVEPQLNLTADGILAGTVAAEPGNVTVPYATVVVCPLTDLSCTNAIETNATGVFWIGAPAGIDEVSVQSGLYLSNLTKLVNVTPDAFEEIGNVPVFSFGTVHGFVRASPGGARLANVNVSLCSKFSPAGGCLPDVTVTTDANGSFSIPSPAGTFYLYAALAGYNASRFLLIVSPGANLNVGTLFLQEYGEVVGEVVNASGIPLGNATVLPCPTYAGPCGSTAITHPDGAYTLSTAPGPSVLTASAPGYLDGSEEVVVISGWAVPVAPIVLSPIPPDVFENVSGGVTAAATGVGLAGALVVAEEGGSRVAQAVSGAGGEFRFEVRWGTVTVVVGEPNYRSENTTLIVHANVTDVNFALVPMTYLVAGVTSDGGTGTILEGVAIANNGTVVARSDANGAYQLQLPNGTTTLTASYATNGTIQYGTLRVPIQVTGSSVEHNIALPRTQVPLRGVVVNAATGKPLSAASVTLWTPTGRGEGSRSTDATGAFAFGTGPGTYNVSVSAHGFQTANVTVSTGVAGNYTTVSLLPVAGAPEIAGIPTLDLALAVGGAVAVGAAAVVAYRAGRRPPPDDPDAEELLPVYEAPEPEGSA